MTTPLRKLLLPALGGLALAAVGGVAFAAVQYGDEADEVAAARAEFLGADDVQPRHGGRGERR